MGGTRDFPNKLFTIGKNTELNGMFVPFTKGATCFCVMRIRMTGSGISGLLQRLKIERYGMSSLFLLFRSLFHISQLVDEGPHSVRLGVRNRVFTAEIQIIPEPHLIRRVAGSRDQPLEKDCSMSQYVVRDKNHAMLSGKLSNM